MGENSTPSNAVGCAWSCSVHIQGLPQREVIRGSHDCHRRRAGSDRPTGAQRPCYDRRSHDQRQGVGE